jgi:hypothetical protein
MNPRLEQLDLETLSAITRERQVEMRREAQTARALGGNAGKGAWPARLVVVLCVVAPIALWIVRAAEAAGAGGGGGGFIHLMM